MGARRTAAQIEREMRTRRQFALDRVELRGPTGPEREPCGTFGMQKVVDPDTRQIIDQALARKGEKP